jgi:hypothetical protein
MVSFSTLDFTKKNSYNYKIMWRKTINNNNSSDVVIGSCNKTKQNKQKMGGKLEWWTLLHINAINDESFGTHSQVMNALKQVTMCNNREPTRKIKKVF